MDISKFNLGVKGVQVRAVLMSVQGSVVQELACTNVNRGSQCLTGKQPMNRLAVIGFISFGFGWANDAFHGRHPNTSFEFLNVTFKQSQC